MNTFWGKHICGKQGGNPLSSAVRPDIKTGLCPDGTSPCSSHTSAEHTICSSLPQDCPITDIKIVQATDTAHYGDYVTERLQKVNDTHSWWLLYSTTVGDNLPLTTFKIDQYNCLRPDQKQTYIGQDSHPLEKDRVLPSSCSQTIL